MTVKIWRPREGEQEYFVRLDKPHPKYSFAVVWLCNEVGDPIGNGNLLLADGIQTVCKPSAADSAGVILDSKCRWDKDQCIEVLAAELARRQREEG